MILGFFHSFWTFYSRLTLPPHLEKKLIQALEAKAIEAKPQ
jgi:hypothetical protein